MLMFASGLPIDGDTPTDAASLEAGYAAKAKAERPQTKQDNLCRRLAKVDVACKIGHNQQDAERDMLPDQAKERMIEIERELARKGLGIEPSLASLDEEGDALISLRTGECIDEDSIDDEVIELATEWSGLVDIAALAPKSLSDYLFDFRYAQMVKRRMLDGDRIYDAGCTLETEPGEYFVSVKDGLGQFQVSGDVPKSIIDNQWFLVARPRSGIEHLVGKTSFQIVCAPQSGQAQIYASESDSLYSSARRLVGTVSFQDVKDIEIEQRDHRMPERPRGG